MNLLQMREEFCLQSIHFRSVYIHMSVVYCSIFLNEENTWHNPVISSMMFVWKNKPH